MSSIGSSETTSRSPHEPSDDCPEALVRQLNALEDRITDLETTNERLREHVNELEKTATLKWENDTHHRNISVTSPTGTYYPLGVALENRAPKDDLDALAERVTDIEAGRADVIVRSEIDADALPIESRIARLQQGDDGLTENEARAAVLFPTFGGRAKTFGGSKLVMASDAVKRALDEKTDIAADGWHDETIRRVMRRTATLTSHADDPEDRDPQDPSNLLTLGKRHGNLTIEADREEWLEWTEDATRRHGGDEREP